MRIIALSTLRRFCDQPGREEARGGTLTWYRQVLHADWASPADVKRDYGSASLLKDGRVVFNLAGNRYRLVAGITYPFRVVYVRFVGSHAEYDVIDAQTV